MGYQGRPVDNMPSTSLKYDLEMGHWMRSYKSHMASVVDYTQTVKLISGIVLILVSVISIIVIGIYWVVFFD